MSHRDETPLPDGFTSNPREGIGDQETAPPIDGGSEEDRWESTDEVETEAIRNQFGERSENPNLVIISGGRAGEARRLGAGPTVIGRRRSKVDVWFRDPAISRMHAAIEPEGDGEFVLRDLDSSNGTLLNGERIDEPIPLREGDKITLGSAVVLKFTTQDELDEQFQRRMYESSTRDELTGASSRSYLIEQMRAEMAYADRHETRLALLFIDLDRFKDVNDTYGHVIGDEVLVELTRRLREVIRDEDLLARYGGEEFAVLVRQVDLPELRDLAERIRERIASEVFETSADPVSVTVSIGIAEYDSSQMETPDAWIRASDEAMYRAKNAGRNRIETHLGDDAPDAE